MKKFVFLKTYFSPFKPLKLKFYIGKTAIGTPYFLPSSSPKKIGFDFVGLGWKTKWSSTDFRFEHPPVWSFVFFGYQIAIIFQAPHQDHYWESWLFYELETDKNKTKIERIKDMRTRSPQIWTKWDGNKRIKVDYHDVVLKKRYVK